MAGSEGASLCAALATAIGIRGVVVKRRHLLLWQTVRIHLDEVERLGRFIELEAVAPADSDLDHEHRLIVKLRDALGITDERLIALGYAAQTSPRERSQSKLSQGRQRIRAVASAGLGGRVELDAERPLHPRDIVPCTELPADSTIDADRLEAHRSVQARARLVG